MNTFYWIAVTAVIVLSSARLTRLIVHDDFPLTVWLKNLWMAALDGGPRRREWQTLPLCHYCTSFWTTAFVVLFGVWAGVFRREGPVTIGGAATPAQTIWWVVFGTLAASYLAAVFVDRDVNRG